MKTTIATTAFIVALLTAGEAMATCQYGGKWPDCKDKPPVEEPETPKPPVIWFRDLWNSINGPDAWDVNPWVVATSFTTHPTNIDAQEQDQ